MKMKTLVGISCLAALAATSHAQFLAPFAAPGATVVSSIGDLGNGTYGYFWSVGRGDLVEQSYNTGLDDVWSLALYLTVPVNVLNSGAFVDWDVRVNGTTVGSFTVKQGFTGAISKSYTFAPISAIGVDQYDIGIYVTNEVAPGQGSHTISMSNTFVSMCGEPVPEPASMAALGLGVAVLARRRRQS